MVPGLRRIGVATAVAACRKQALCTAAQTSPGSGAPPAAPSVAYAKLVAGGQLSRDWHQLQVLHHLDRLHGEVLSTGYLLSRPEAGGGARLLSWLFLGGLLGRKSLATGQGVDDGGVSSAPRGVYIHGGVGGGKSMLVDLFYGCCPGGVDASDEKRRMHFHDFMTEVHQRIHRLKVADRSVKGAYDPIGPVAADIAGRTRLLCLDEFQVTDIADAMILKRLFTVLFASGLVLVASSNRSPDSLYKNGLQRANFVPFIPVLKRHCQIVELGSGIDYRRLAASALGDRSDGDRRTYFVGADSASVVAMEMLYRRMCSAEAGPPGPARLRVFGRDVTFERCKGGVLFAAFDELCCQPLAAADYVAICHRFHCVFLAGVPVLSLRNRSSMRRFITLIDTIYDKKCRLVISAAQPPDTLFQTEESLDEAERHRMQVLRDDLGVSVHGANPEAAGAAIFTGEEEIFAHERTVSRLTEMMSAQYWNVTARDALT